MNRRAIAMPELLACLVLTGLIATLAGGASAAARERGAIDATSARLEEAQNLLARWRAGGNPAGDGFTAQVEAVAAGEVLELRGHGLRLSTLRPAPKSTP